MSTPLPGSVHGWISDLAWLAGYGLVALAVALVSRRWLLAAEKVSALAADLEYKPDAIAYLSGGPERALIAALSSMRIAGTIAPHDREVRAVGELNEDASALERAIHATAAIPIRWDYLDADPTVAPELEQLRCWLEDAGLLLTGEQQRRITHTGRWMGAVMILGLGLAAVTGTPYLIGGVVFCLVLLAGSLAPVIDAPRTREGTARMHALRQRYGALSPQMHPDFNYRPAYAGLAVAIFGLTALNETDPAFAQLLGHGYGHWGIQDIPG